ncbi:hypothetical protein V8D89_014359 [Ganoderma adspersum]
MYESITIPERLLLWVYTNPARSVRALKRDTVHRAWHTSQILPALRDNVPPTLFLACSRWVAADGAAPTYLSLYDLARHRSGSDNGGRGLLWHDPAYVALSEKHAGEARAAAAFVEGRVYEPLAAPFPSPLHSPFPPWNDGSTSSETDETDDDDDEDGDKGGPRTRYISVIEVDLHAFAEGEFCRWYDEEHIPLLARVPGWVRSRRYVLKEKLGVGASSLEEEEEAEAEVEAEAEAERGLDGEGVATATATTDSEDGNRDAGEGAGKEREGARARGRNSKGGREFEREEDPDAGGPPKFLAIHEWASLDAFETKQYRRATNTPWRTAVLKEGRVLRYEIRVFRAA